MADAIPVNPAYLTTHEYAHSGTHVSINTDQLDDFTHNLKDDALELPAWDASVFPDHTTDSGVTFDDALTFLLVGNTLNFCFRNKEGDRYATTYMDNLWGGAFGMWASLHRAHTSPDYPDILDPETLSTITADDLTHVFDTTTIPIPLREERADMLNGLGTALKAYNGSTLNLINSADGYLFHPDKTQAGLLPRLVTEAPVAYRDSYRTDDGIIWVNKRAQLAIAMMHGYAYNRGHELFEDLYQLTAFADYGVPATLHSYGVLEYSDELQADIDNRNEIPPGSQKELELRACTIHACDRIKANLHLLRTDSADVSIPRIDYLLWKQRQDVDTDPHFTRTTAY